MIPQKLEYLYFISPVFFHFYWEENVFGDGSAGENLENLKTTRDAYFGLGISEYIKKQLKTCGRGTFL
jgi:hypothetical protein